MKHVVIMMLIVISSPLITACNTMEGVGQDIQRGGEKLEQSADSHK